MSEVGSRMDGIGGADARVPADASAVHDAAAAVLRDGHVPGLSLVVVDRDGVLLAQGFGAADIRSATPTTARTSYLWFSMTKVVTATAALRLAEQGRLDLEAPAEEYVAALRRPRGPRPTVRQLLDHTAGLANPLPIRWAHAADAAAPDPDDLLGRVMSRRRAFAYEAGTAPHYSNVGYLAAGAAIAAAAGRPFVDYVQDEVLAPAGMRGTGFAYQPGAPRATGYVSVPRAADALLRRVLPTGVAGARHGRFLALEPFYVDGPAYGGLVGDVLDVGRLLRLHLRDGEIDGNRVLGAAGARAMRGSALPGHAPGHGLGWNLRPDVDGPGCVEHAGGGVGFWNLMRLYPRQGLGIAVMTNTTAPCDVEPLFALLAAIARG